jgi:aspartate 1-decarboxylase
VQPIFKRTAIHNLRVTSAAPAGGGLDEGLVLPRSIMALADISSFEQIVATNMNGSHWDNRLRTFAVPGPEQAVVAHGSLTRFLRPGDLICVISRGQLDRDGLAEFEGGRLPWVDVGFEPKSNQRNRFEDAEVMLEYVDRKEPVSSPPDPVLEARDRHSARTHLSHLISNLRVNETHPDCLQGSAELPEDVLEKAGLSRYRSVLVYNADRGGVAETYVVPTPSGVVMTTGAMANFAPKGSLTHVAAFAVGRPDGPPMLLRIHDNSPTAAETLEWDAART